MKRSKNVLKYRYHVLRPFLIQPVCWALFFLSPVFDWFRIDMIAQRLVVLGKAYPFEQQYLQWLPLGFYGGVLAIALTCVFFGRIFCGWGCPHNTMTEWTRALRAAVGREEKPRWMKLAIRKQPLLQVVFALLSPAIALLMTFGLTFLLVGFVVPPAWVLGQYASGQPHIALLFGQFLFTLIGLFLLYCGHDFCRTCCPYGMGQSISSYMAGKWAPMEIKFTGNVESQCKTCTACQIACPVDIDPRDPANLKVGQFDGCFNCGECIDACKYIHSFKREAGLLSFTPPGVFRPRQPVISKKAEG
jgi:ferredoxin-type protein NapH